VSSSLRGLIPVKVMLVVLFAASALFAQTPTITSLTVNGVANVNAGAVGASVTILGASFGTQGQSSTVTFGNLAATPISWSATSILVNVPTGAITGNIVVNPAGTPSRPWAFMVVPGPQTPGINFVQGHYETTATVKSVSVVYTAAQAAGDLNVVVAGWRNNACTITSVTDNSANAYVLALGPTHLNNETQSIYYAKNIAAAGAGVNKATVLFSCTGTLNNDVRIAEYSGMSTTNPVDVVSSLTAFTSTCATPAVTTTNANDLLFGTNYVIVEPISAGTGYTSRVVTTNLVNSTSVGPSLVEDRVVTATGSYSASATMPKAGDCIMQMVAFRAAPNQAPVVSAGSNQTIALPTNTATLTGTATDDGLPNKSLTLAWTQVSGPGTATFSTPTTASTQVTVPQVAGTYIFKLTANDSALSTSATMTLTVNPVVVNLSVALTPTIAGPNVTGTTQKMTAVVTNTSTGTPVSGTSVQFTVTGVNPTTGSGTTDATGTATFTYTGANKGADAVQASTQGFSSNTASINWITPVKVISTSTVLGQFFVATAASAANGIFDIQPGTSSAFTQEFPTVDFNPPSGTIPGNTSSVTTTTRPFTDVTTDLNGNFNGTIVAQGNGFQAGVGSLKYFESVFTGSFTVATAGNVVFDIYSDDGFILGINGGATRVSGPQINVPANGLSPFQQYTVVGAYNQGTSPTGNTVVVNFPAAGTYQYELDYTECCSGFLSLTMAIGASGATGAAPTGSLTLTPVTPPVLAPGQTQTLSVQATDGSGIAVPNQPLQLYVNGVNTQILNATTNSTGVATFQYAGANGGIDMVQAVGNLSAMQAFSNQVTISWSTSTGGGTGTIQGWIGTPALGAVIQNQATVTVAAGITLASGTLKYFPTSNPNAAVVLSSNTTGSGMIGTFDATLLQSGGYTIQLDATSSTGVTQRSLIAVQVLGDNKPGRKKVTVTDFKVPLAGIPINIARTYDSLVRGKVGDFGQGWFLDVGVDLTVDAFNNVSFNFNKQRVVFNFTPHSTGSALFAWLLVPAYMPAPGYHGTLTSDGCNALVQVQNDVVCFPGSALYQPTTYTYTDPAGRVYKIAATGVLQSIKDLNGNLLTVTPGGISSSAGGVSVPFVRDGQGRITQITDPNGKNYTYSYDGSGNLSGVTLPGIATATSYTYSADHSLLTIVDPLGATTTTTYDASGRVASLTDPLNQITQYTYDLSRNRTIATLPNGLLHVEDDDAAGKPLSIVDNSNNFVLSTTYTYDAQENPVTMAGTLGNVTTYTYDANGFITSKKDPLGNTTTYVNNQYGEVTSSTDPLGNVRTFSYDANFNLIKIMDSLGTIRSSTFDAQGNEVTRTDANGNTTQTSYDVRGFLVGTTDALNETTSYVNDAMGRVATRTDPRSNQTADAYDSIGNLLSVNEPLGRTTSYTYDFNGNKLTEKDPRGNTTAYTYDLLNRVTKITYPDATTRQFTYDFRNNKLTETDQSGRVTKYGYDVWGRLLNVTAAFGTVDAGGVQYNYDGDSRKTQYIDERNNLTKYAYDNAGHLTSVVDALNNSTTYGYDADGRKTSAKDANNNTTSYSYDARSRLITTTFPDTTTTQNTYDGVGRLLAVSDQAGKITTNVYDKVERLTKVTDAAGQITTYTVDPNGNLLSVTDGLGRVTLYTYDALNRRSTRSLPLGQSETYGYDFGSNLTSKKDFNGKTTTYTYDTLNRLLTKVPDASLSQPTDTFTYTPTGQRASMVDASGTTSYTSYDNRDRLKTKVTPQGTLNYTYDAHSNVLSIVSSNTNGASANYTYDALNRPATVVNNRIVAQGGAGTTTYAYDPVGNFLTDTAPNGAVTTYTYNTLNRLTNMATAKAATTLASFAYTLAPAGNRTVAADLGGRTAAYGYDNDYRLTSEAITADPGGVNGTVGYTVYDLANNRKTMTSTLSAIPAGTFSYDNNDRLTTDIYDANGNTTSSGGITRTYDFENHLTGYGAVVLTNDGDGNRVSEMIGGVTTKYLVDTLNPTGYAQVMDEVVGTAVNRTYAYGLRRISENQLVGSTWTPSFYGYDGHGNVRFLTSSAGAVTDTYKYDAFGVLIGGSGTTANSFLYSGQQYDSTLGLYYLRARYYNPAVGRFQTADSYEGRIGDPATLHKYIYTRNDPVNRIDPSGKNDAEEEVEILADEVEEVTNSLKTLKRHQIRSQNPFYRISDVGTEDFSDEVLDKFVEIYNALKE